MAVFTIEAVGSFMKFLLRDDSLDLGQVVIKTDRVQLQPVSMDFAPEIFRHFTLEITRYMVPAPAEKLSDTAEFVEAALRGFRRCEDLHLVIVSRVGHEFLGVCGLHSRGKPKEPELGVWLKKSAHRNGYGLEAITALKNWVEINLELDRLLYPVDRRNIPSRRIPECLGGKVVSTVKVMSMGGSELDEVVYGIEVD